MSDPNFSPATIEKIVQLADKANSTIEFFETPYGDTGVPPAFPVMIDRVSGRVSSVKTLMDEYRLRPERKTGTATVATEESFIELVDRHATPHSAIFANIDWQKPGLTAVIDYHEIKPDEETAGTPAFGRHRIHYPFPLSQEWQEWTSLAGKPLKQAEVLSSDIADLAQPDEQEAQDFQQMFGYRCASPNELLMLSRNLQIFSEVKVKNAQVLQTGETDFIFEEVQKDAQGNKLNVPGMFILSIAPFFQGPRARVPVRLRTRVLGGVITWTYLLFRPDIHVTEHLNRTIDRVKSATGLPVYAGEPEMPGVKTA